MPEDNANESSRKAGALPISKSLSTKRMEAQFNGGLGKMKSTLTAQLTQEAIMRQVVQDESLSGETTSWRSSGDTSSKMRHLLHSASEMTGEDSLRMHTTKESLFNSIRRTLVIFDRRGNTGLNKRVLMRTVMEDERQWKTCLSVPTTLFFALIFVAFFQQHYQTSRLFLQEQAIRSSLGAGPMNVTSSEEIYSWLSEGMFPWLWSAANVPGQGGYSDSVGSANRLVAGVLLRTARGPNEPCEAAIGTDVGARNCTKMNPRVPSDAAILSNWDFHGRRLQGMAWKEDPPLSGLVRWLPGRYWPGGSRGDTPRRKRRRRLDDRTRDAQRRSWGSSSQSRARELQLDRLWAARRAGLPGPRRNLQNEAARPAPSLLHGQKQATREKADDPEAGHRRLTFLNKAWVNRPVDFIAKDKTYTLAVPHSMDLVDVQALLNNLEHNRLVDDSTQFLTAEFFFQSDDIAGGVLTHTVVAWMFSRGGAIYSEIYIQSINLQLTMRAMGLVFLWAVSLTWLTVTQVVMLVVSARRGAFRSTFFKFGRLVDVAICFFGWVILLSVGVELLGASTFNQLWEQYQEERLSADQSAIQVFDADWLSKFANETVGVLGLSKELIGFVSDYNVLVTLRFLIATMGHPRLAIIVRTAITGATDLMHLLFIIILFLMAYTLSGHILLGPRMEEMSTFKGAWGYCLQIVFQREYNWDRMTQEGMLTMTLWIVSFILFLIVVLMNLVLAMIFDHYGEVRSAVSKDDTIWRFFVRMTTQLRLQSSWVSNTSLLVKLSQLPHEELLTPNALQRLIPNIHHEQVSHLFHTAAQKQVLRHATQGNGAFTKFVAGMLLIVTDTRRSVQTMALGRSMETADEKPRPRPSTRASRKLDAEEDMLVPDEIMLQDLPLCGPGGEALATEPEWLQAGVLRSLREQRKVMREINAQMEEMKDTLSQRGIGGRLAPWSPGAPPVPSLAMLQADDNEPSPRQPGQQAASKKRSPRPQLARGPRRSPRAGSAPWSPGYRDGQDYFSI